MPPAFLHAAFTDRSIDEPTDLSGAELPCGTIFSGLLGTFLYPPAGPVFLNMRRLEGQE